MSGRERGAMKTIKIITYFDIDDLPGHVTECLGGCVYILQYGDHVKIGKTINLPRRLKELVARAQNYSNCDVTQIAHTEPLENYGEIETNLISDMSEFRINNGELFSCSFPQAIEALRERESQMIKGVPQEYAPPEKDVVFDILCRCQSISAGLIDKHRGWRKGTTARKVRSAIPHMVEGKDYWTKDNFNWGESLSVSMSGYLKSIRCSNDPQSWWTFNMMADCTERICKKHERRRSG